MKRYKKILMIWICAIVVVAVSVIVALYDNANQGQDVAKEVAVETLRKVAERVVNREFDGLGCSMHLGLIVVRSIPKGKRYQKMVNLK